MIKTYKDLNLIFLGAPGAGKGTVAGELVAKDHFYQLSTGEMFREEIRNQTPLGLKVKDITSRGEYVSDDITNEIVKNKLQELVSKNRHYILDGYPRTLNQVKYLETLDFTSIDYVILLEIDQETVIKRLSNRRVCSNCGATYHLINKKPSTEGICDNCKGSLIQRKDDYSDVILKRLQVYREQTKPLIEHYKNKGNLITIDATQEIWDVYLDIVDNLKKALK